MKKICTLFLLTFLAGFHAFSKPYGPSSVSLMRSYLYVLGTAGDTTLMDGDLTQYDPSFSNVVDGLDARKMSNPGENIGMIRGTTTLVIERRHTIQNNDTIFYRIWNLKASRNYQLQFTASDMAQPGLSAYLEDLYLNTKTPVSLEGTTYANININADPASYDTYRFRIIFTTAVAGALPLNFTMVKAYQQGSAVKIDWKTATENNLVNYTVERSGDGQSFAPLASLKANNLAINEYSYTDNIPPAGNNYYRISSTGITGAIKYSAVMKVVLGKGFSLINVFPNPIAGNTVNLQFVNQPAGLYRIKLVNTFGQSLMQAQVQYPGGSSTRTLNLQPGITKGIYHLEIAAPGGTKTSVSLVY